MKVQMYGIVLAFAVGILVLSTLHPAYARQSSSAKTRRDEFLDSVARGDVPKMKEILKKDPSLASATDKDGVSAILKAVYYRKRAVVDLLLASGIELNIFEASATGQTGRVRELLGKDPESVNAYAPDGFYPLGLAIFFGHRETAELLLASGAKVDLSSRNQMKVMPLHSAAAARETELARLLIDHGADVNARQQCGFTPLHEVASHGQIEFAKLLVAHGADVNARTDSQKTALTFALENNQGEMAAFLREHGAVQ